TVGINPFGISVTPDSAKVYVASPTSNTVSVIDAASNTVIDTVTAGSYPAALGVFIQQMPTFAGTPGAINCQGVSVSALATKYDGLNKAAAVFGFAKVQGLQDAIRAFCRRTTS